MRNKRLKHILVAVLFAGSLSISAQTKTEKADQKKIDIVEEKVGITPAADSPLAHLYKEAVAWLKTPYRRGGMTAKGIDCSGFTKTVYKNVFGIQLNRVSTDIASKDVEDVKKEELKPGDLVFFATSRRKKGVNHVGVYLGNNHFVHASTSKGVTISSLDEPYYKRTWVKGGQVKDLDPSLLEDSYFIPNNIEAKLLMVKAVESQQPVMPKSFETILLSNPAIQQ